MDTVIVGGGQAGLSISYYLKQQGREHIILEKSDQVSESWRNRWDSFTLITPNWMVRLPGAEYSGDSPDDFMLRDDVVTYFEKYIEKFNLPIKFRSPVTSVEPAKDGYLIHTNKDEIEAANVVIATGRYQQPRIPKSSENLSPDVLQLHSSEYRNPEILPAGGVLVVGSAQSGAQIAEEIYESGRKVYLSVSNTGRLPRRYRGKDITIWLDEVFSEMTVEDLPTPEAKFAGSAHGTGKNGGHTINLNKFAKDGVVLLGHFQSGEGTRLVFMPDLKESLAAADKFEAKIVKAIDEYIEKNELENPEETLPVFKDGYESSEVIHLDLKSEGINSIIWATGFTFDFNLVKLPVFEEDGYPSQKRGVTKYPGLYFLGLPFLYNSKSGLLAGVGDDACYLASVIDKNGNK